jgi:cytochrome c-type biogenesis protein CcmH/NrfG
MKAESIVFAVAGMCFGIILGWVIGIQQAENQPAPVAPPQAAAPPAQGQQQQPPPLDEGRVQALTTVFNSDPKNADAAVQLGNVYFDAERYQDAIKWYEEGVRLNPKDPDASTDLGISYYYTGQTDRALAQFESSLKIDPRHSKTFLNKGIVLAFGKQDLAAAEAAWKEVVAIAPNSPEGQAAQKALEGIAAAGHSTGGPAGAATPGS